MPRTLNKTYRLIAGDRQDNYRESMADNMCIGGGFWTPVLLLVGIFIVVALIKDMKNVSDGVFAYLFGSKEALTLYAVMLLLLVVGYIVFQIWVNVKTKAIMDSKEFKATNTYFENLKYDIYLTKRFAEAKAKEHRKTMKKARNEGIVTDHTNTHFSKKQMETRKNTYRVTLLSAVKDVLESNGYSTESRYYNQCYILHAHSISSMQPNCDFFITKENCFLRGCTRFNYGAHQNCRMSP